VTRTTLKLDAALLRKLKQQAAAEGTTLQDLANRLLRGALARPQKRPYTLTLAGWSATVQPGVDLLDRDSLFDAMQGR
jgi:hypothetical protein